ncbi:MAG TPA: matrixin family metalloprotease [archaeon]|nr:matrixin family metalloprotease [archaeon]
MRYIAALVLAVLVSGCVTDNFVDEPPQNITIRQDYYEYSVPANFANFTPLLFELPVVKSPMPYYVYNDSELNPYKYNVTLVNIKKAFDAWQNATNDKVIFNRTLEKPDLGISIKLLSDIPNNTVGEASALFYKRNNYTLIVGGEMQIETLYGGSENRVLLIHEIGHIMGFDHSDNSHSVMFPYNAYSQVITDDILNTLDSIYKNVTVS